LLEQSLTINLGGFEVGKSNYEQQFLDLVIARASRHYHRLDVSLKMFLHLVDSELLMMVICDNIRGRGKRIVK